VHVHVDVHVHEESDMRKTTMIAACLVLLAPAAAEAFCGFYVSGADAKLFNNATQVTLMRKGTRTVLAMQNNYQGPTENFAMVVPVPVVLQKENVVTLPREIFTRVDQLSAPRLVEYWEQDPCAVELDYKSRAMSKSAPMASAPRRESAKGDLGVTIEAKFTVGEYQILILSAKEATGLDTWLRREKYTIPEGAEPYLKPYVEGGSKFFVAKVDVKKVKFENGQAMLSPLRFHYDTEQFNLPIRLGMMNSAGTQDLIVTVLAEQRYEVANYKNVTIPTNLDVKEEARERFGEFYAALFDRTLEKNPGAVVTEYAWDARSCDPCPTPPLSPGDLATLGADVLDAPMKTAAPAKKEAKKPTGNPADDLLAEKSVAPIRRPPPRMSGFVLTRLHARYSKDGINEDLVFKAASSIAGGREWRGPDGKLEERSVANPINNFQARYAIRHEWTGPITCESPVRGRWGGPPAGTQQVATGPKAATDLAFVPRGKAQVAMMVRQDVPEIDVKAGQAEPVAPATDDPAAPTPPAETPPPATRPAKKEKEGCAVGGGSSGWLALMFLGLALRFRRRR
jgi:MYXO-CTERM domain-containing protein